MKVTISLAQLDVITSQPEENLRKGETLIAEAAKRGSNVVCLPEMWTTGFNWKNNEKLAGDWEYTAGRIGDMAKRYGLWINGTIPTLNEQGRIANTSLLFDDRGRLAGLYRKTHLFSLLHEDEHMAPGSSLTVVDTPWGKTGLTVCYDIRFPELYRSYALKGVTLVFVPMAFPYPRLDHWKILARARAIENQMFIAGVNQVGREDFGADGWVTYFGHSAVIDPWGQAVIEAGETEETLLTATIDTDRVAEIRTTMTVLRDRRPDIYELS